jgi:hypothetical protein
LFVWIKFGLRSKKVELKPAHFFSFQSMEDGIGLLKS